MTFNEFFWVQHAIPRSTRKFVEKRECSAPIKGGIAVVAEDIVRGANENMNGLIRQFFPKKMIFDSITSQDIRFAMNRLNHRSRKCLGSEHLTQFLWSS